MGIEKQVDEFLDHVSEAGLLLKQGVKDYLQEDQVAFKQKLERISEAEHIGDGLRRSLEELLYSKTLIPESRGDVLELLESMDSLLDRFKGTLWRFEIERPEIYPEFHQKFLDLVNCVVESVEAMVRAARAFFKDINAVADHMHKVPFWETESDKISSALQRKIFRREDMRLSHRSQIRDFVRHVDKIADRAEDVADRMSIYVIKRSL
jgi:predicted phosphate transport protein (TIGR00153 family)